MHAEKGSGDLSCPRRGLSQCSARYPPWKSGAGSGGGGGCGTIMVPALAAPQSVLVPEVIPEPLPRVVESPLSTLRAQRMWLNFP